MMEDCNVWLHRTQYGVGCFSMTKKIRSRHRGEEIIDDNNNNLKKLISDSSFIVSKLRNPSKVVTICCSWRIFLL